MTQGILLTATVRLPTSSAHRASQYLLSSQWVGPEAIIILKDLQTNRLIFSLSNKQIPGVSLFLPSSNKDNHSAAAREKDIVYKYFYFVRAFIAWLGVLFLLLKCVLTSTFYYHSSLKHFLGKINNYIPTQPLVL